MPVSRQVQTAAQIAAGSASPLGANSAGTQGVTPGGAIFALNRVPAGINGFPHLSNRCRIADGTSTGAVKTTSRTRLTLPFGGSDLRLKYTNRITNSGGGEADATATITVSASVEHSQGNPPLVVTWNGQLSVSIPPGQDVYSDPIGADLVAPSVVWAVSCVSGASWPINMTTVAIAANGGKDGDMLGQKITAVSGNAVSPIAITTSGNHGLTTGDLVTVVGVGGNTAANQASVACTVTGATTFSIVGVGNGAYTSGGYVLGNDITALGGNNMLSSGGVNVFAPIAVIGIPPQGVQVPWAALFGDSITNGSGDNNLSNAGWVVRALGGPTGCTIPFINLSRSGTKALDFADVPNMATKSQGRRRIGMGAPYTFNGYSRNDWSSAATLANLQIYTLAIATSSYRRGGRNITATSFPGTSSTDSFVTAANQSTIAGEAVRTGFNDWLRDGAPIDATTLVAVAVGTSTNVLRAGTVGHPIWMVVDPTAYVEVDATGALVVNGGRWKVSTGAVTANIATNTTLTVTANTGPALYVGATVIGPGIQALTTITALGTGTGGAGTYTMSLAATATTVGIAVTVPPSTDGTHPASWVAILASAAIDSTRLVAYA